MTILRDLPSELIGTGHTRLVKDKKYLGMWRIKYGDETESDMYNLTRAKQHLRIYKQREEEENDGKL